MYILNQHGLTFSQHGGVNMKDYAKLKGFIKNNRAKERLFKQISNHPAFWFNPKKSKQIAIDLRDMLDQYAIFLKVN